MKLDPGPVTHAPRPTHRIQGLVFDKDGTLFDFRQTWNTWCAGFIRNLCGGDAAAARMLATALHYDLGRSQFASTSPVIAGTMDVVVNAIRATFPDRSDAEIRAEVLRATSAVDQKEAAPLRPLMEALRRAGHILGVATNDAEAAARTHLRAAGIHDDFAFISGYDSGYGPKPGPAMLLAFCDLTGIAPEEAVMVGDSTHDLLAGRAAGMQTVGVLTGLASAADLAPLADAILPDIGALPGWLAQQDAA